MILGAVLMAQQKRTVSISGAYLTPLQISKPIQTGGRDDSLS